MRSHRLVDHRHAFRSSDIFRSELAALQQVSADGVHVAGADAIVVRRAVLGRAGDEARHLQRRRTLAPAEDPILREADRLHAGNPGDALGELASEVDRAIAAVVARHLVEDDDEEMVTVESCIHALDLLQRPDQQRRAHEKDERERDLASDEQLT